MDPEKAILDFVHEALLPEPQPLNPHTSLFSAGIVDSMALVELIDFLERTFHIKVQPIDIVSENFDTIKKITSLVSRKQKMMEC